LRFKSDIQRGEISHAKDDRSEIAAINSHALPADLRAHVARNVLRGPRQTNVDFALLKRFPIKETQSIEFRADFFNLLNHVNLANPISNLKAVPASGGSIDPNTGQIISPGDFGRIISTSNNPRIIQFALKFNF
jgi:hypothetical protein